MEYFYVRWRWILLFALLVPEIDGIQANPDVTESAAVMIPNRASNNCGSKRIFESIASIKQLQGCQVIEGDLQMLLIESKDNLTSEWKKYTFPDLVEITGYLLVFRVQGLHSLGQLFPNLTVIRGLTTHMNYALIIWRAEDMETVGLPKLTSILRGGVWIDNNAKLCTVDTDWSAITAGQDVENILRTKSNCVPCNSSETCRLENCASGTRCQEKCNPECGNRGCTSNNECCPEECVGGCQTVNGSTYCTACRHLREGRHVKEGSFCTEKCSRHFYKYLGYKCVTDLECSEKGGYFHEASSGELECVRQCPLGYKEETNLGLDGQEVPQCKKCDGGVCDKTCPGRFVRNARNAQALKGCTVINGSLEISIPGRKDISKTLMESLRNLKEVTGYVRIFRSKSLTSLDFLSSLVAIGRDKLYGDKYALCVHENEKLEKIWDWKSHVKLTIRKKHAKILFYSNPHLCYDEIRRVLNSVGQLEEEESLVMKLTNGNKMACQTMNMSISASPVERRGVLKIDWFKFLGRYDDPLMGYYVYYKPVNTNAREDSYADDWMEKYLMDKFENQTEGYLTDLEPNTTYTIYMESDVIMNKENGFRVRSPTANGTTVAFNPDSPSDLKVNRDFATVSWSPLPHRANRVIDHYVVKVEKWPFPTVTGCEGYDDADGHSPQVKDNMITSTPSMTVLNSTVTRQEESRDPLPSRLETRRQQLERETVFHNSLFNLVYRSAEPQQQSYNIEDSIREYAVSSELDVKVPEGPSPTTSAYINPDNVDQMSRKEFPISGQLTMSTRATNLTIPGLQPFTRYLVKVVACHPPERSRVLCSTEPKTISFITPKISTGGSHKVTDLELKDGLTGRHRISWRPPLTLRGELVAYLVTLRLRLPANYRSSKSYSTVFCITDRDFKEKNNTFEIEETYLEPGLYTVGVEALTNPPSPSNDSHAYVDIAVKMEILPTVLQSPTVIAGVLSGCFVGSTILGVILRVVFKKAPKGNDLHLAVKEDTIRDDVSSSSTNQQLRLMFPESQILKGYLRVSRLLAKGTYGSVYLGEMRPPNAPASVPIAVKKSRSSYRKDEILNEAKLMLELDCHHLVKSYGIATKSSQVYLVMDLAQQDLLSFLRSLKPMDGNVFSSLDLQKVCAIAIQIADGMAYLAKHAIIHRDLAARNCLMFENLHVKISDFGMSRVTDNNCYYTKTTKYFPVRWLPPEYFKHNRFTCQSDVWSYGVVLWEILSKGALPYKDVRLGDVKAHVTNGNTLESEIVCQTPPFMSAMMTSCWNMDEKRRPYFPQIVRTLYPHISPSFRTHFGKVSFYDTEEGQEYKRQVDWLQDSASNHPVHCDQDLGCDTQPPQLPARPSCKMKRFAFLPTLVLSDMIPKRFSLGTPDYENLLKTNVGEDPSKAPQETQSLLEIRNVVIDGESETGSVAGIGSAHISSPHLKNRMTPPKSSCMMKWFASLPTLVFLDTMPKRYSLETPVSENVLKTTISDDPSEVHQEAQSLLDTSNIVIDEESVTGSVAGTGSAHRVSSYLENRTTTSKSSFGICSSKLDLKSKFEKPYSSLESNEDTDDQVESTSVNLDLQRVRYSFTSTRNFPKCRPGKRSKSFSYHGVSSPNIKDGTS